MSKDDEIGPMQARSDLIDILSQYSENTEALVILIQSELKDLKDRDVVNDISNTITEAASQSKVDPATRDNVLYWLTETTPDVRQMILVQTIEELLKMDNCREATISALVKISSQENVDMVMEWVNHSILTLSQAVYVLLYPDSSAALK
ncbi:hypothetical protein E4H12_12520 [Candidatus Thorarchaeota archaeon]|nr:MAG: hypothetical protein E4H12_12520 [Candidatus Thorarchaeota archaeon]